MHGDTNANGRHSGTVRVRAVWLDTGARGNPALSANDDQLDEMQFQSPMSADVDGTAENLDESDSSVGATPGFDAGSGGFVDGNDEPEGGSVDDDSPELDDDAGIDAHPRHPERDSRGRFNGRRPGPGRPRGCRNYRTLQAVELRRRIVDSWDRVNGDRLLDQLAKTDPVEYLRLVCRLLPAERREPGVEPKQLVLNIMPLGAVPRREPGDLRALPAVDPAGE